MSGGYAQPAVSHQLRVLRDLNLAIGVRSGRRTVYALHDPHVAALLEEARVISSISAPARRSSRRPLNWMSNW